MNHKGGYIVLNRDIKNLFYVCVRGFIDNSRCIEQAIWRIQEHIRTGVTRVRACNYVNIKAGQNFPPVLKLVTHTAQAV